MVKRRFPTLAVFALNLACVAGCCFARGSQLEYVGPHCTHPSVDPRSPQSVTFTTHPPSPGTVIVEARETDLRYEAYPWDAQYGNKHARSLQSKTLTTLRIIAADETRTRAICEVEQSELHSKVRFGRLFQTSWFGIEAQSEAPWGELVDVQVTSLSPNSGFLFFTSDRCVTQFEPTGLFLRQGPGARVLHLGDKREANYQTRSWLSVQNLITPLLGSPVYVSVQLHSVHSGLAEFSVCAHEPRDVVSGQPYHFMASGHWLVAVDGSYTVGFDLQGKYYAPTFERPVGEYHTWSRLILPPAPLPRAED